MESGLPEARRAFSIRQVVLVAIVAAVLTGVAAVAIVASNVFVTEFRPVSLTPREQNVLSEKMDRIADRAGHAHDSSPLREAESSETLAPEPYSEENTKREIRLTERELNAMLARNTDLAKKLAIDLSGNLVSAKVLLPLDDEFPVLGGKTLKITAGVELAFRNQKPIVNIRGISLWGVPLPNAWIGGVKNIDLVEQYGDSGFWKAFADGVEDLHVEEGNLVIRLKP